MAVAQSRSLLYAGLVLDTYTAMLQFWVACWLLCCCAGRPSCSISLCFKECRTFVHRLNMADKPFGNKAEDLFTGFSNNCSLWVHKSIRSTALSPVFTAGLAD